MDSGRSRQDSLTGEGADAPMRAARAIATLAAMSIERRSEPREALSLHVCVGPGESGVIRDISASGLFLETAFDSAPGDLLDLEFALDSATVRFKFLAQAFVLRTEPRHEKCGVAVKLLTTRMATVA